MTETASPWVEGLTIGAMLRRSAETHGDRDAVVFPGLDRDERPVPADTAADQRANCYRLSYAELDAEVDRVAASLLAMGIEKGDHVAVWATNWPRWALLQFATARVGAVMVTINPAYRSAELSYVLKQSDAAALFLVDRFRTSDYFDILNEAVPGLADAASESLELSDFPKLRRVVSMTDNKANGILNWEEFLQLGSGQSALSLAEREAQLDAGDPINIQYTSGTTGFPKGAMLTHRNLLLNAYYCGVCQKITDADRICVPVPFYHCFGCVLGVLCSAVYGAALVVPAEYFDPQATLDGIEAERVTTIYGVPTMFIAQLEHPSFEGRDLKSLRTGIMAGSPCPIEVMKRVVDDMGAEQITIAYGQTEASPIITQSRTDDSVEVRVETVGRPIPGVEVKIVDPGTGETLGDGEQGELCTRGHVVMLGYYNMADATATAIDADGWLHTGDLSLRNPDGNYRITGRIKEMIIRGGENVYPREIEEFLFTHPAVQDVAVFGIPDPKFVEDVAAWVILKEGETATEDDIRDYCKQKLAHYKVPRHVRFVAEFPQTVTGKIRKFEIREIMSKELGLEEQQTA